MPRIHRCLPATDWGVRRVLGIFRMALFTTIRGVFARRDCKRAMHSLRFSAVQLEMLKGLDLRRRYRIIRGLSEGVKFMTALFPTQAKIL